MTESSIQRDRDELALAERLAKADRIITRFAVVWLADAINGRTRPSDSMRRVARRAINYGNRYLVDKR